MRARPGRLLPSVIVGGLLISGLALGAGTASAATCKSATGADVPNLGVMIKADASGACELTALGTKTYGTLDAAVTALLGGAEDKAPEPATPTATLPDSNSGVPKDTEPSAGGKPSVETTSSAPAKPTAPVVAPVGQPPAAVLPPPALGAPAPLAAAGPVGALPALPPLAGVAPAGLASSLFGANAYDPGLLMGSPLGNAASALFSPQADSAVTTVSQAQALAATGTSGYGTPVTIGVIILACLIGFAVRHRVISRMKSRELPAAEYQPRHAAPEPTPEQEPETDLHPAADDAKTLVVLTRR